MGAIKQYLVETEDGQRADAWDDAPIFYEVTIQGELCRNHAVGWITPVVGEDEIELHCVSESPDHVVYKGLFPTIAAAEAAIDELVARARCSYEPRGR